jgi:mannosyltransferase OCH1-like enzyme
MDKKWWLLLLGFIILIILFFYKKRIETFESGIPKIIHQTAPSDESKWPSIWKECQQSWKDLHPDFEYRFWSDEDIDSFMKENYPDFYENVFTKYDVHIKRVDAVRYFILKDFGGIYADMDYMCQKRFFEELPVDKVSISEPPWTKGSGTTYENALMVSPKDHPFWDHVIEKMKEKKNEPLVFDSTGPHLIMSCVNDMNDSVFTLVSSEYDPGTITESTKTIHKRTGVWNVTHSPK